MDPDDEPDSCVDGGALGTAAVEALAVDLGEVVASGFGIGILLDIAYGSLSSAGLGGGRLRGGELLRAFDVVLSVHVTALPLVGEIETGLFLVLGSFPLRT